MCPNPENPSQPSEKNSKSYIPCQESQIKNSTMRANLMNYHEMVPLDEKPVFSAILTDRASPSKPSATTKPPSGWLSMFG